MAKDNDNTVYAFSDGSALGNPGPGGYGVVLKYGDNLKELSQGYVHTTNNRMELMGAIMALESLKERQRVVLTTDSQYVINGIEKGWARKWRANGWMRNRKERALNPGHMGHPENERCDELANGAARGSDLIEDKVFVEAGG